jgi:hypothetical protein
MARDLSRREFIAIGVSIAMSASAGPRPGISEAIAATAPSRVIYRLSLRGRRGSQAAKRHNANKRFASEQAANLHRAHPGDHSRIVPLTVSDRVYRLLFPNPESLVADLRTVLHNSCVGDCAGDGAVTVDELLTGVNIALGNVPLETCTAFDSNRDKQVTIDELLAAVNRALNGCG